MLWFKKKKKFKDIVINKDNSFLFRVKSRYNGDMYLIDINGNIKEAEAYYYSDEPLKNIGDKIDYTNTEWYIRHETRLEMYENKVTKEFAEEYFPEYPKYL